MSKAFKLFAATILAGAASTVYADPATTSGGIKVRTEDGRFEATVGGRIQFDYYLFSEDESARIGSTPIGSAVPGTGANRGGAAFRRTYLTLTGKAYGWEYKFEDDFVTTNTEAGSFREMWIATKVGPGKLIIGQHKPFRGMEELASSNEITLMERPFTTANGVYANRQFAKGLFYKGNTDTFGYGVHVATLGAFAATTEGHTFGARGYYFPFSEDGRTLHVALAYSSDREDLNADTAAATFQYAGRRGPRITLGNAGASVASGFGTQNTIHAEIAGTYGSFTAQAEYVNSKLENGFDVAGGGQDEDTKINGYYGQVSYFLTGEKKVYKKDRGAFGSPKPINSYGAVEVAARYDVAENESTVNAQARGCVLGGVAAGSYQSCEGSVLTLGANWYVNPNVRFMANYYLGSADVGTGKDEPEALSFRAQMSF